MAQVMKFQKIGNCFELTREQWKGKVAYISDYPDLLKEVLKYTWTYNSGYLINSKLSMSLHKFVLEFLYGKENLSKLLTNNCIIEHLDNNGLNCCYDNLHILSADYNKAKAFTIDKTEQVKIPRFILDTFYSHEGQYYQLQITFNENIFYLFNNKTGSELAIEAFYLKYQKFTNLFLDWLYLINLNGANIDEKKFHNDGGFIIPRPKIELKPEENDAVFISRGDKIYLRIDTSGGPRTAFVSKTKFKKIQ